MSTDAPHDDSPGHHHDHAHDHGHEQVSEIDGAPAGRPRRQEQEEASREVTEVAPGVLRSQLPISLPGLGHVNCYILEDSQGVALVDPGLDNAESWTALQDRLATAGVPLARVHSVIITHSHPDHFGLAHRIRKETGAAIVTHSNFHVLWDPREPPDIDLDDLGDALVMHDERGRPRRRYPWDPSPWGGEGINVPWKRRMQIRVMRRIPRFLRLPTPSIRLDDAQIHTFANREWVAIHTPGHTDDHLCLFDPAEGVMLSGDHVLPTITPHISGLIRNADPLKAFFSSLDKVAEFGPQVRIALPAHGHPFADLAGRAQSIKTHHEERLQVLRDAAITIGRPASVTELSHHLFKQRSWGAMAESETFAHLEHLRLIGEMNRDDVDAGYAYTLAD
jgi:glyoxylase-like metal-dependent hydrolase (beta-lactamase superfamily II)